jgi:hypothetical protein
MQSTIGDDSEDKTRDLPPELIGGPIPRIPATRRPRLIAIGSVVALAVLLVTSLFLATRGRGSGVLGNGPAFEGCGDNTPCQVANSYLTDYVAGKYDDLYGLVSQQTIKQFDDPRILRGNYQNAHDYITTRTKDILARAQIASLTASPDTAQKTGATTATVPARVELQSSRVGSFEQDISIPLVYENNRWRVVWTPGLIFTQLNDSSDPYYSRKVDLIALDGARGAIFDRDGNVLAKDDTVYDISVTTAKLTDKTGELTTLQCAS